MTKPHPKLITATITALLASSLQAGTVRLYDSGAVPHPCVVARILSHANAARCTRGATRGLSMNPRSNSDNVVYTDIGRDLREEEITASAESAVAAWEGRLRGHVERIARVEKYDDHPTNGALPHTPRTLEPDFTPSDDPPLVSSTVTQQPSVVPADSEALAVVIAFANNSARVQSDATAVLDAVAEGIKLSRYERKIIIEGHTNASGKPSYNTKLSLRRAQAVKRYLVNRHGIPERVLVAVGLGSKAPLSDYEPHASENRRVQFKASQG